MLFYVTFFAKKVTQKSKSKKELINNKIQQQKIKIKKTLILTNLKFDARFALMQNFFMLTFLNNKEEKWHE